MSKRTKIFIALGIILAIVVAFSIIIVSTNSEVVPDIYAFSNSNNKAMAVRMGYKWNSFNGEIIADSVELKDIEYKNENMLLALPGEKITIKNSETSTKCHKFYPESFKYYDKSNSEVTITVAEDLLYKESKLFEFNAPETEGTYIYNFTLNYYKKGTVTYALKVVVSSAPTYSINEIVKYKDTYLGDAVSVGAILDNLPYAKYKEGYVLRTVNEPYELIVNYGELSTAKSTFENSSIALFALIQNLDIITYKVTDETYIYSREEIENLVGRDLTEYANNPELWEKEIMFKEKANKNQTSYIDIYKSIMSDILAEFDSNNKIEIAVDLQSFENNEFIKLNSVEKRELLEFCMNNSDIIHECNYETFNGKATVIYCLEVLNEEEIYTLKIGINKNGKVEEHIYVAQYLEDKWNVEER